METADDLLGLAAEPHVEGLAARLGELARQRAELDAAAADEREAQLARLGAVSAGAQAALDEPVHADRLRALDGRGQGHDVRRGARVPASAATAARRRGVRGVGD